MNVKHGDKFPLTFTVNRDLAGTTTRLIVRHLELGGEKEDLTHTVSGSTVTHVLDGTWARGSHYLELEITDGDEIRTAPSEGQFRIQVLPDLDM